MFAPRDQAGAEHPGGHGTPPAQPARGPRHPHPTAHLEKLGGSEGERQSDEQSGCSTTPPASEMSPGRMPGRLGAGKPLAIPWANACCRGAGNGVYRVRGGALGVSYPPCSWLRGARLACRRCRGPCGEEYTAMSRMASGVQPPGSPMHHPAAVPEGPGRAVGDFTMGDFTKGSAWWRLLQSLPPRVGCKRLVDTGVGAAEVSSQHQTVTQKPARGGGQTPGKAKPLCILRVHGGWVCMPACACTGAHGCPCTRGGARVCSRSRQASALSAKTQGPGGCADGAAPLGAL